MNIYILGPDTKERDPLHSSRRANVYIRQIQIVRQCVYCGNSAVCSTAIAPEGGAPSALQPVELANRK